MKAIVISEPEKLEIKDLDVAPRKENEALIRMISVGICGSDITAYRGTNPTVTYPLVLGHEAIGIIEEIEDNPKGLVKGDRVAIEPFINCGHCEPCKNGHGNNCVRLQVIGVREDGAMAEYFNHPVKHLYKVPDSLADDVATMIEPTSIALHAVHRANIRGSEKVAIYGSGTIGLLAALICKAYGATPIIIDVVDSKLEVAKDNGIDFVVNSKKENVASKLEEYIGRESVDVVLECSGSKYAMYDAIDIIGHGGRIAFVGWETGDIVLNQPPIIRKEIQILGSRNSYNEFDESIELLDSKKVDVSGLIDHRQGFEGVIEGINDILDAKSDYIKIVSSI